MCASIIVQNIQLENSRFTFVNKLMEQKEDTLTVIRQSSALAESEKSSDFVNISQKKVNELLSSIRSNMLRGNSKWDFYFQHFLYAIEGTKGFKMVYHKLCGVN